MCETRVTCSQMQLKELRVCLGLFIFDCPPVPYRQRVAIENGSGIELEPEEETLRCMETKVLRDPSQDPT
jgi:hypothetical protein